MSFVKKKKMNMVRIGVVFSVAKLKAGHLTMFPHGFLWVYDNPCFFFPNMQSVIVTPKQPV